MDPYYVNKKAQSDSGDHEVHTTGCPTPADLSNRLQLGKFSSCAPAVSEAKKTYPQSNGCANCCPDCHTE